MAFYFLKDIPKVVTFISTKRLHALIQRFEVVKVRPSTMLITVPKKMQQLGLGLGAVHIIYSHGCKPVTIQKAIHSLEFHFQALLHFFEDLGAGRRTID